MKILVVGCGNMGSHHARAYHRMPELEIVGLVSRGTSAQKLSDELGGYPTFSDYDQALAATRPDAVSINTYPDTHYAYIRAALEAGAHVFTEKPLATTVAEANQLKQLAQAKGLKLVVGYILRVHPAWQRFIQEARQLGRPLVMRMNLNQQSHGASWRTHQQLMQSMSPMVDCGVHYVDIMCQMTQSPPVAVSAIGARLSDELPEGMYNYSQLQVRFADGSVGWYEAGWGPMMSETAYFIKDAIGPNGSVSIVNRQTEKSGSSDDVDGHVGTNSLLIHRAATDAQGAFLEPDRWIDTTDEPDHQGLCDLEQAYFVRCIQEDLDLEDHLRDAVNSLRIVLAADESVKSGKVVPL